MTRYIERCYACGRQLGKNPRLVDTRDDQKVFVGRECVKKIEAAGEAGYQPPRGGPRLWLLREHVGPVETVVSRRLPLDRMIEHPPPYDVT